MESRFPGGSVVKNPPDSAGEEMHIRCLVQEGPMEKEMATHSSILAWEILWTEEPGRLQLIGVTKEHDLAAKQVHGRRYHDLLNVFHALSCLTVPLVMISRF